MAIQAQVLVADGHALCSEGFAALARHAISDVQLFQCGEFSGIPAILDHNPEITLMLIDADLPGLVDLSCIAQLRQRFPAANVAVTSHTLNRDVALSSLALGIHGYILKSSPREELIFAIRSVRDGRFYYPRNLAEYTAPGCREIAAYPLLSSRQMEILALLSTGMANKQIARELKIAEGTVKVHLNAAFRALGVHNRAGAVSALHELGERMLPRISAGSSATEHTPLP